MRHILSEDLEHVVRLLPKISLLDIIIVVSEELLVSLLGIGHALLFRSRRISGGTACRHVELRRSIDHNEVILASIIIHVLLNIIVGLLYIIELLLLEIIVVYRCVVIIVILYLDVLSCLGALGLLLYWRAMLLFTSHLRTHVRAWRWGPEDVIAWHEEIVEVVLFLQPFFIELFVW
jgi:hypothetical protein